MLTEIAALLWVDDRLEHGPKDVWVDLAPDQRPGLDEQVAGILREGWHHVVSLHREQSAIDVGEPDEMARLQRWFFGVQCCEQVVEEVGEI